MKNPDFILKRFKNIFPLFLVIIIILPGCRKEEEPDPTQNNEPDKPFLTETIGKDGGTIETDSFVLVIPPGSFSADCKLEVFVSEVEQPFKSIALTRLYKIKGLPDDLTDSLPLKMKYSGTLIDDSFLCHGSNYYDELLDSTYVGYDLVDCKDSSGYLVGYFKPNIKQKTSKSSNHKTSFQNDTDIDEMFDFFLGLTSYRAYETPIYHVAIKYPTTLDPAVIQKYSSYLEEIYLFFQNIGFNNIRFYTIEFFDFRELPGKSIAGFRFDKNYNSIDYWTLKIYYSNDDPDQMISLRKSTIVSIFKKFIKDKNIIINQSDLWFNDGSIGWCQQSILKENMIKQNIASVFKGLSESGVEVVTYLANTYGTSFISDVYKEIQQGADVLTAISSIIQSHESYWFPDFFRNYLEGNISNISGKDFNEIVFQDQNITYKHNFPVLNTPTNIINEYANLSAKIFYFNTNDDRINESSNVSLNVDNMDVSTDDLRLLVFSYQRTTHEIKCIKEGTEIQVTNLKKLKDGGSDLLVVVVNSYYARDEASQNYSNIKLMVEFKDVERLNISKCSIWLFNADVKYRYDDNSEFSITESFNFTNDNKVDGDLEYVNDSTLKAEWDFTAADTRYWGDVILIIDQESYFISSIESNRNERTINEDKHWNWKKEYYISCKDIQLDTDNLNFKVEKDDLLNKLEIFEHRQEWYTESELSYAREVEDISTNTESYLSIEFY